ncbi:MAG: chitobiase/beta-hexosaminidase C-terminal domain-containing protein [Lentimicrobiaceae bacterium]|nr:chitobiase/beta-hexosaminidase C-terminal domain-containing protein [Lentimicrobiaceae bacterium]
MVAVCLYKKVEPEPTPSENQVATPTFTPDAGSYVTPQEIKIECETEGATIHYALNSDNFTEYSQPISLSTSGEYTIKAYATKTGMDQSITATKTYIIDILEGDEYEKVTSEDQLVSGAEYLIANSNGSYLLSYQKSGNRHAVNSKQTGNTLIVTPASAVSDQTHAYTIVIEKVGSNYTLKDEIAGQYLQNAAASNGLKLGAAAQEWAITISNGATSIVQQSGSNNYYNCMQYNSGSTLFNCYSTASQEAVTLYKKVGSEPEPTCDAVTDVEVSDITTTTAKITWTAPATAPQNYTITLLGDDETDKEETVEGTATEYTFSGLSPYTEYVYSIKVNCSETLSSTEVDGEFTTKCEPVNEQEVKVEKTHNTVKVSWTAPQSAPAKYTVTLKKNGEQVATHSGAETEYEFTSLDPETEYSWHIVSNCSDDDASAEIMGEVTTDKEPVCDPVENLSATLEDDNSIKLTWTRTEDPGEGFQIEWYAEDDEQEAKQSHTADATARDYTITGLTAGKKYMITVVALCGGTLSGSTAESAEVDIPEADEKSIIINLPASEGVVINNRAKVTFSYQVTNFTLGTDGKVKYTISGDRLEADIKDETTETSFTHTFEKSGSYKVELELVNTEDEALEPPVKVSRNFTVNLPNLATPRLTPVQETHTAAISVEMFCDTAGATIYYSLSETDYNTNKAEFTQYNNTAISLDKSGTYKFVLFAVKQYYDTSALKYKTYTLDIPLVPVAKPTFDLNGTTEYEGEQTLHITTATEGASIYYTLNGDEPTAQSTLYTEAGVKLSATTTVKAIAVKEGMANSQVATVTIKFKAQPQENTVATIAELRAGTVTTTYTLSGKVVVTDMLRTTANTSVWVQDETGGMLLYGKNEFFTQNYAVGDGITGVNGALTDYNGLLELTAAKEQPAASSQNNKVDTTIVTIAELTGANRSQYESKLVRINKVSLVDKSGNWTTNTDTVVDEAGNKLAVRPASGRDYVGNPKPTGDFDMVALVGFYKTLVQVTPRYQSDIIPLREAAAKPTFNLSEETEYETEQQLEISCATADAKIYYTINGDNPTTESTEYTGPITLHKTSTVKAIAVKEGIDNSLVAEITVHFKVIVRGELVFHEYFENIGGTPSNSTQIKWEQLPGWSGDKVYPAGSRLKIGTSSAKGTVTLPNIDLSYDNGTYYVLFTAQAWKNDKTEINLIANGETAVVTDMNNISDGTTFDPDAAKEYVFMFENGTEATEITFEAINASGNRFFLDSIRIYQVLPDDPMLVVSKKVEISTLQTIEASQTITVNGRKIKEDVTVTCPEGNFSVSPATLSKDDVLSEEGAELTITYNGALLSDSVKITLKSDDLTATVSVYATAEALTEVADIAALRAGTQGAYYKVKGEVVLTAMDTYRNYKWIQDAAGAILIDDPNGYVTNTYEVGDGITGVYGQLGDYKGQLQLVMIKNLPEASSHNNAVEPVILTVKELEANKDKYCSQLIRINGLSLDDESGEWKSDADHYAADADGNAINIRTFVRNGSFVGQAKPQGDFDLICLAGIYDGKVQVSPRTGNDILPAGAPACYAPTELKITVSNFKATASWKGYTDEYELVLLSQDGADTLFKTTLTETEYTFGEEVKLNTEYAWAVASICEDGSLRWAKGANFTVTSTANVDMDQIVLGVYPNPNDGIAYIELAQDVRMEIFTATGTLLRSAELTAGKNEIRFNQSGIYFIRLANAQGAIVKRIIVR